MRISTILAFSFVAAALTSVFAEGVRALNRNLNENGDDDRYIRDANDTAAHPGSIIWGGGQGNRNATQGGSAFSTLCFSADATVQVQRMKKNKNKNNNGAMVPSLFSSFESTVTTTRTVAMKDLRVGDAVLVAGGTGTHQLRYEPVYAFAHQNEARMGDFLRLHTSGSSSVPLEMSPRHMVFLHDKRNPVTADTVRVGDILRGAGNSHDDEGKHNVYKVTKIDSIQKRGIYAPLTKKGTLVVDGMLVSAYTSLQQASTNDRVELFGWSTPLSQQNYCDFGLSPFRLLCTLSSSLCNLHNADGMPHYISFSVQVTDWVYHPQRSVLVQFMYMTIFVVAMSLCVLAETIMCNPLAISVVVGLLVLHRNFSLRISRVEKQEDTHTRTSSTATATAIATTGGNSTTAD